MDQNKLNKLLIVCAVWHALTLIITQAPDEARRRPGTEGRAGQRHTLPEPRRGSAAVESAAEKSGSNLRAGHTLPEPSSGRGRGRSPGPGGVKRSGGNLRGGPSRGPARHSLCCWVGAVNPGEAATRGLLSVGEVPLPLPPLGAPPLPQEEGAVLAGGLHALAVGDAPAAGGEGQAGARVVLARPQPSSTPLTYVLRGLPVSLGLGPTQLHSLKELQ